MFSFQENTMQFQILDVDYTLVDNRPVVRVFGKGKGGETICGFYENYAPYFYARGADVPRALEGDELVSRIEKTKRGLPLATLFCNLDITSSLLCL